MRERLSGDFAHGDHVAIQDLTPYSLFDRLYYSLFRPIDQASFLDFPASLRAAASRLRAFFGSRGNFNFAFAFGFAFNIRGAFIRGRPPSLPFSRLAAALASLRDFPPRAPMRAAIQRLEPSKPSSIAGTYRSASSFGKCRPKPDGVISIALSS